MKNRQSLKYSPSFGVNSIQIWALVTIGVVIPLFSFLKANPAYFVANGISANLIYGSILGLCLLLPAIICVGLLLVSKIRSGIYQPTHEFVVFGFLSLYFLSILTNSGLDSILPWSLSLALAAIVGVAVLHLYRINRYVYTGLAMLAVLTVCFPIYFLADSNVRDVLNAGTTDNHEIGSLKIENRPPIVMILFDELPLVDLLDAEGEIDGSRFPNFYRLANMSTWYKYATTVHGRTLQSIPSILSGQYPKPGDVLPIAANYPDVLFNTLNGVYELHTLEQITMLRPDAVGVGTDEQGTIMGQYAGDLMVMYLNEVLPQRLAERWVPMPEGVWGNFLEREESGPRADRNGQKELHDMIMGRLTQDRPNEIYQFGEEVNGYPENTFHFVHSYIPHRPFRYLPSGKHYNSHNTPELARSPAATDVYLARKSRETLHAHLLQVGTADTILGEFMDMLAELNLLERSMLIVISDHGIAIRPKVPDRVLTEETVGAIGFIPLFIKFPNQSAASVDATNVQSIDVAPTILDVLGAENGPRYDGRSLIDGAAVIPKNKRFGNFNGEVFELSQEKSVLRFNQEHKRYIERRTLDHPKSSLFQYGPGLDYLGLSETEIENIAIEARIESSDFEPLTKIDSNAHYLPVLIKGTVRTKSGKSVEDLIVAISLNGVIEGVAQPEVIGDDMVFHTTLPETKLIRGENRFQAFLLPGQQ